MTRIGTVGNGDLAASAIATNTLDIAIVRGCTGTAVYAKPDIALKLPSRLFVEDHAVAEAEYRMFSYIGQISVEEQLRTLFQDVTITP